MFFLYVVIFVFVFLLVVISVAYAQFEAKIDKLKKFSLTLSPEEFFDLRNAKIGNHGEKVASIYNFAGVYVLYNKSKNMYYVGQAKKVFNRVNAHFTGHGNGDVYADYKYGDIFEISMIALDNSGFSTLNELERNTISRYNAFSKGYNRTRGNRG